VLSAMIVFLVSRNARQGPRTFGNTCGEQD
jgi:hypothetical protein